MFAKCTPSPTINQNISILDYLRQVRLQSSSVFRNTFQCAYNIIRSEGVSALFRGILPPLITSASVNALVFSSYGAILNIVTGPAKQSDHVDMAIAGGLAGIIPTIIVCPADNIKIRLQSSASQHGNIFEHMSATFNRHGYRSLFPGFWITLYREIPAWSCYFSSYHYIHHKILDSKMCDESFSSAISGAAAGALSWLVVYPIDVIKTNIQLLPHDSKSSQKSIYNASKLIIQTYGYKHLYKGLNITLIRSIPANAVTFPVYNYTYDLMHAMHIP